MSYKTKYVSNKITLLEGDNNIINDPKQVSNVLNQYLATATDHIGQPDKIEDNASLYDITEPHINKECITQLKVKWKITKVSHSRMYHQMKYINTLQK